MIERNVGKHIIIHHKDHNKQNNCLDNLELISSKAHHMEHVKDYWEKNPNGTKRLVYGNKPTKYALSLGGNQQ